MRVLKKQLITRKQVIEMAVNKRDYQKFVSDHISQVAQNWCLMMYCKKYRHNLANTYEHWRTELEEQLDQINTRPLENKKMNQLKYTKEVLLNKEELNNPNQVYKICRLKFKHENEGRGGKQKLGITEEQQKEMCALFAQSINDIIDCICSADITTYTNSVFPPLN